MTPDLQTRIKIWITQTGEQIRIQDMNTWHMFHAVRMLFNHTVPKEHATGLHKRYNMQDQDPKLRGMVMFAMLQILIERNDLTGWMRDELGHMARVANELLNHRMPQLVLKSNVKRSFDEV